MVSAKVVEGKRYQFENFACYAKSTFVNDRFVAMYWYMEVVRLADGIFTQPVSEFDKVVLERVYLAFQTAYECHHTSLFNSMAFCTLQKREVQADMAEWTRQNLILEKLKL